MGELYLLKSYSFASSWFMKIVNLPTPRMETQLYVNLNIL